MLVLPQNPVTEEVLLTLRDPATEREQFIQASRCLGYHLGLALSGYLRTHDQTVLTLMGELASHTVVADELVIIPLLRAGMPVGEGLLDAYPRAEMGHIDIARDEETLASRIAFESIPDLEGRTAIIADMMVATGGSAMNAIRRVEQYDPGRILFVGGIASDAGFGKLLHEDVHGYVAAIDPVLTDRGFISPGLGDAGDRCYGSKLPR